MVLLDSSIWIAVARDKLRLRDVVPRGVPIATCPMVIHEVLRGARDEKRHDAARETLFETRILDAPTPLVRFEEAAKLYRACRQAGVTPSSSDALIAACAISHDVPLLHVDNDFLHIARVAPRLRLVTPS